MLREIDKLADRHENKGARVFYAALKSQYLKAADFIEKNGNLIFFAVDEIPMRNAMRSFHTTVQLESADIQYRDLRKNNPVKAGIAVGAELSTEWIRKIQAWVMANTGDHITKINDTTLDRIRSIFAENVADGLGPRDIAKRIRKEAGEPFTVYRSTVIARTEATRSASQGHKIASDAWERETGQKSYKQWSATNDSRTRDAHRAMLVLHIIPKGDKFTVGGAEMDAPGDPAGGAKNVVNCRCRIYYMSERVAKKLIAREKPTEQVEQVEKPDPRIPINISNYEKKTGVKVDRSIFNSLSEIVPMTNKNEGSYFDPNTKSVNLVIDERSLRSKWSAESVVYHEYGHAIDHQKGMRKDGAATSLMNDFREKLSRNKDAGYIELDKKVGVDVRAAFKAGDFDELEKIGAFADTLMALDPRFGGGHSKEYFEYRGMKEAEFIAHSFENKFIGNSYFEKAAPELYKEMIAYIEKYL